MTADAECPFPGSYWVLPGRLLAGGYPGHPDAAMERARLEALLDAGVRSVIDLTEEHEPSLAAIPFRPYGATLEALARASGVRVAVERHPIPDMSTPSAAEMRRTLDAIDARLAAGGAVYVHCRGGYGRTGTVVGCWLARHAVAAGPEVLDRLRQLRAGLKGDSPQTDAQRALVAAWKAGD